VQRETVIERGIPADKVSTVITMPRFVPHLRPREEREHEPVFRMVNHGTISKRLGNDLILEAAAKLIHEIPGFELHFIGAGDNLDHLVTQSSSLGLTDHVHFHDVVPWDQLAEKLSIMDVGIVANRINVATDLMLPSKLIDYVVLGIPAIVPRLRAIEYYFSEDMVAYFEAENVDSMVATTVSLYRDKARRERQPVKARKFWDENQWEGTGKGLQSLYEGLFLGHESGSQPIKIDGASLTMSPEKAAQDSQGQYSTKP
jgi:glycosyltransferase involved in cell wall biosynthesis